jgi:molybdate-binding protein/DNA-binding PadR family transcriptional regulator
MALTHVLLGLLKRGERYGYQMRRELEDELGPEWRLDFGQLYRLLRRMEGDDWIRAHNRRRGAGPTQKTYTITRAGRAAFKAWLRQTAASTGTRGRDELAAKLHFAVQMNGGPVDALLDARRTALAEQRSIAQSRCDIAHKSRDPGRWLAAEAVRQRALNALASLTACEPLVTVARSKRTVPRELIAIGSDDLVLASLSQHLEEKHPGIRFVTESVGSLAGLLALRDGRAHLAGIHLLDIQSGEYNVSFIRHLLPEEPMLLVNLARREQGLMVATGNPKGIRRLRDLARTDVRLINRQPGAGTRLLLFHRLRRARIDPHTIRGYQREATTHTAVAAAIKAGRADVGPGIRAAARAWGLDFIHLGQERYDLAIPRRIYESAQLRPLLEALQASDFRRTAASFDGYDIDDMSRIVAAVH